MVRDKPPLPPEGKRPMSPGLSRKSCKPPTPRSFSPEPVRQTQKPIPLTPEAEIDKILNVETPPPPKRNSVVFAVPGYDVEDSRTFRPISPSPITGSRNSSRHMSPTPRPFSPLPEWPDEDSPPPLPFYSPPSSPSTSPLPSSPSPSSPEAPPPPPSSSSSKFQQSRSSSQPSNIILRITPRDRRRPVSAPGISGSQKLFSSSSRPLSPNSHPSRPKSSMENSRFVRYRSFQAMDEKLKEFLKPRDPPPPPQVLVEPKWQVRLKFIHSFIQR